MHSIYRCEVIHIVKEDSATHNAIQAGSGCLENCRDILNRALGLLACVARDDLLGYGIEGKLPADENKPTAVDRVRVVPHTGSITGTNEAQISVLYAATPQS